MRKAILHKLRESFTSVFPIVLVVLILNFTPLIDLSVGEMITFTICSMLLILGITLFNLGADLAMTPMGEHIGAGLTKLKSLILLLSVCFGMGILITVAEPDLSVLAGQVSEIMNGTLLIMTVGIGVGLFLAFAIIKIVFRTSLSQMLMFFYMFLFAFASLLLTRGGSQLIPLAFDSGGVTTGPITVPFIMALGVGIATTLGGKDAGENSFGLIAMCSVGPMLAVLVLGCSATGDIAPFEPSYGIDITFVNVLHEIILTAKEVGIALGLIILFFVVLQLVVLKLPQKRLFQIAIGILYTFVGLVIFLSAVKVGFMEIGYKIGTQLAEKPIFLAIFAFLIGMLVVLAEPAVHVLNKQVEDITEGTVSKRSMMIALSIGVGISICLSIIRIIFDFHILYYLIPGYLLSLGLSFFVPKMYTAIAFDSGGVASGPLTSTFILPFAVGACAVICGTEGILSNAFGIVSMVAMTPLITIQLLGFRAIMAKHIARKIAMQKILAADDEQIIEFK